MTVEKPEIKELLRRLDELIRILKYLSEDLNEISKTLRTTVNSSVSEPQQTITFDEPSFSLEAGQTLTVENVQKVFPQDLGRMLYFEVTEDYVIIKPRQYLGSENFAKIATVIRDRLNGEYVSQGRESHFRIPRKL